MIKPMLLLLVVLYIAVSAIYGIYWRKDILDAAKKVWGGDGCLRNPFAYFAIILCALVAWWCDVPVIGPFFKRWFARHGATTDEDVDSPR